MPDIKYAQTEAVDKGSLKVEVLTNRTRRPIEGARITISYSGDPDSTVEEVSADDSGMSEKLTLDAPPLEYSMEPSENQPFAQYTVKVTAPGYRPVSISGVQVFSEQLALQQVRMAEENEEENQIDSIVIPVNTLFGNFPAKIAESEIKPVSDSGEIVLSKVVIPEFVVVHDGPPSDPNAANYYVRYRDYIKNVASSEIYSTWPDSTLRANILAIMSFTLNRLVLQIFLIASDRHLESKFITNILGSGIVTFLSLIVLSAGIPILQDKVVIGDIMPLVPGIALTTSIRDFFNGDYLSGAIHMIDAILTAFSIAVGVGAVITLYQLVTGGALLR